MSDQNKEILLKLIIDGKEAYSTLKITDAEIKKIRQTAGLLGDEFTKSYQSLTGAEAYICENFSCRLPVTSEKDLIALLSFK